MISFERFKNWFKTNRIPEHELKECEGFNLAQEHLLLRLDQDWNSTLPIKYQYDQSLRKARVVWFEHFIGPVVVPTAIMVFCSSKFLRNLHLRTAAIFISFAAGAKLYMNEYKSFDLNIERTYKVLMCPTPIGKECRDILKEHNPDHWILDKYEIDAYKLRAKMANNKGDTYREWYQRKKYSEDIFDETVHENDGNTDKSDDYTVEMDETIYGKTSFIPEYPLPKHELTYATSDYDEYGSDDDDYENAKANTIAIRPETRFVKEHMWPKALIESEEFKKKEDKQIFRDFGVDIDTDNEMQKELLSDIPKPSFYTDEQCWQIEEDWRKCKLMVRRGKAKASECKKLKSDMKMCRGLAAMSRLKGL